MVCLYTPSKKNLLVQKIVPYIAFIKYYICWVSPNLKSYLYELIRTHSFFFLISTQKEKSTKKENISKKRS